MSIAHPPSACPNCEHPIRGRDNIPIVSWLLLRAKCRDCGQPISFRYPLVEFATASTFVLLTLWSTTISSGLWLLPALLYFACVSIALSLIDIDTKKLPNVIVVPSILVIIVLLALASLGTGNWWSLVWAIAGAAILFTFYLIMALVYPAGMGFGDVKLAAVIGAILGYLGWGSLIVGAFAAFLLGGIFSIGLLIFSQATRKTGIPFGPWMLLGAWVGIIFGREIATLYLTLVGIG